MEIVTPIRIFKLGSITLPDPDPSLPPEQAIQVYAGNFPQVVDAELEEPVLSDAGELTYVVRKQTVKTKG